MKMLMAMAAGRLVRDIGTCSGVSLPVILSRIKYGRENWIVCLWGRLQWFTFSTRSMARQMQMAMQASVTVASLYQSTVCDGLIR